VLLDHLVAVVVSRKLCSKRWGISTRWPKEALSVLHAQKYRDETKFIVARDYSSLIFYVKRIMKQSEVKRIMFDDSMFKS